MTATWENTFEILETQHSNGKNSHCAENDLPTSPQAGLATKRDTPTSPNAAPHSRTPPPNHEPPPWNITLHQSWKKNIWNIQVSKYKHLTIHYSNTLCQIQNRKCYIYSLNFSEYILICWYLDNYILKQDTCTETKKTNNLLTIRKKNVKKKTYKKENKKVQPKKKIILSSLWLKWLLLTHF